MSDATTRPDVAPRRQARHAQCQRQILGLTVIPLCSVPLPRRYPVAAARHLLALIVVANTLLWGAAGRAEVDLVSPTTNPEKALYLTNETVNLLANDEVARFAGNAEGFAKLQSLATNIGRGLAGFNSLKAAAEGDFTMAGIAVLQQALTEWATASLGGGPAAPYLAAINAISLVGTKTIESFRAVEATGKALDIEVLLSTVRFDRTLRKPGQLIQINPTTVNYVFTKYLLAGDPTWNRLMASYAESLEQSVSTGLNRVQIYLAQENAYKNICRLMMQEINLMIETERQWAEIRRLFKQHEPELKALEELGRKLQNLPDPGALLQVNAGLIERYKTLAESAPGRLAGLREKADLGGARELRFQLWTATLTIQQQGYCFGPFKSMALIRGAELAGLYDRLKAVLGQADGLANELGGEQERLEQERVRREMAEAEKAFKAFTRFPVELDKTSQPRLDALLARVDSYFQNGTGFTNIYTETQAEIKSIDSDRQEFFARQRRAQEAAYSERRAAAYPKGDPGKLSNFLLQHAGNDQDSRNRAIKEYNRLTDNYTQELAAARPVLEALEAGWSLFQRQLAVAAAGSPDYKAVTDRIQMWEQVNSMLRQQDERILRDPPGFGDDQLKAWGETYASLARDSASWATGAPASLFPQLAGTDVAAMLRQIEAFIGERDAFIAANLRNRENNPRLPDGFAPFSTGVLGQGVAAAVAALANARELAVQLQEYVRERGRIPARLLEVRQAYGIRALPPGLNETLTAHEANLRLAKDTLAKVEDGSRAHDTYQTLRDKYAGALAEAEAERRSAAYVRKILAPLAALPLFANFKQLAGAHQAGAPLKVSQVYNFTTPVAGYLSRGQINEFCNRIDQCLGEQFETSRGDWLRRHAPQLHAHILGIREFLASRVRPVEQNQILGADGRTVLGIEELRNELKGIPAEADLRAWERRWQELFKANGIPVVRNSLHGLVAEFFRVLDHTENLVRLQAQAAEARAARLRELQTLFNQAQGRPRNEAGLTQLNDLRRQFAHQAENAGLGADPEVRRMAETLEALSRAIAAEVAAAAKTGVREISFDQVLVDGKPYREPVTMVGETRRNRVVITGTLSTEGGLPERLEVRAGGQELQAKLKTGRPGADGEPVLSSFECTVPLQAGEQKTIELSAQAGGRGARLRFAVQAQAAAGDLAKVGAEIAENIATAIERRDLRRLFGLFNQDDFQGDLQQLEERLETLLKAGQLSCKARPGRVRTGNTGWSLELAWILNNGQQDTSGQTTLLLDPANRIIGVQGAFLDLRTGAGAGGGAVLANVKTATFKNGASFNFETGQVIQSQNAVMFYAMGPGDGEIMAEGGWQLRRLSGVEFGTVGSIPGGAWEYHLEPEVGEVYAARRGGSNRIYVFEIQQMNQNQIRLRYRQL